MSKKTRYNKATLAVKGLESLGTLETLILASNEIETLHPTLRRLDNLQDLDLTGNRLSSVSTLRGVKRLAVLRVSDNRLSSWKEIPSIPTLTELHARGNRLTCSPSNPDTFPGEFFLFIFHNDILLLVLKIFSPI